MTKKSRLWTVKRYRAKNGEWRWTLHAGNGRKIACSGEGYKNISHCVRMTVRLFPWVTP